jgi:hypothetical protein
MWQTGECFFITKSKQKVEWRKCQSKELRNFHSSENIIRLFNYRKMDSAGHVTHMRNEKYLKKIVMCERRTHLREKRSGRKHNTKCRIYKKQVLKPGVNSSGQYIIISMLCCMRLRNLGLFWEKVSKILFQLIDYCFSYEIITRRALKVYAIHDVMLRP